MVAGTSARKSRSVGLDRQWTLLLSFSDCPEEGELRNDTYAGEGLGDDLGMGDSVLGCELQDEEAPDCGEGPTRHMPRCREGRWQERRLSNVGALRLLSLSSSESCRLPSNSGSVNSVDPNEGAIPKNGLLATKAWSMDCLGGAYNDE